MYNWGIVKKFSSWIGMVLIVFTVLAGLLNYAINRVMYSSAAPLELFVYNFIIAMLPFLTAAVVSFTVAALSGQQEKQEMEKEHETTKTAGTQPELDTFTKTLT
jgi:large-conductance mechanosensitive channel